MFHLFNTDLGGVRGTCGFFLSMATRGLRGDYELVGASITTDGLTGPERSPPQA